MTAQIIKYPRTQHLEGSALQQGDHDLSQVPFQSVKWHRLVVEEKLDGAQSAFFFDHKGRPQAQSRGHLLDMTRSGGRERHFNLLKAWVNAHQDAFFDRLGDRYRVYGEWMHCAHTIYYDALPHWFLEFDVWDREQECFLDTPTRRELLDGLPIASVPVLKPLPQRLEVEISGPEGQLRAARQAIWNPEQGAPGRRYESLDQLLSLLRASVFKTLHWREAAAATARQHGLDQARTLAKLDDGLDSEGLYVKVEEEGRVVGRFKWVRHGFLQKVFETDEHWMSKPILPNALAPGVDVFDLELAGPTP